MEFDWHPVQLSFVVALAALPLVFVAGSAAAFFMTRRYFKGIEFIEGILLLPLVLPPVVVGYALLVMASRYGFVGAWLENTFGFRLLFTPYAAVVASAAVAFPLMYQCAKTAFAGIDTRLQEAASSLGASLPQVFFTIVMPLSIPGLVAGAVLTFARGLSEFGATIMVAGNIQGRTTTMPTAIYMAAEGGDLKLAGYYCLILAAVNLFFMVGVGLWLRGRVFPFYYGNR